MNKKVPQPILDFLPHEIAIEAAVSDFETALSKVDIIKSECTSESASAAGYSLIELLYDGSTIVAGENTKQPLKACSHLNPSPTKHD